MSYRERANITVYCHAGEHCALNTVTDPSPLNDKWDSDALHDHAREYFGINTTSSASGSGSSSKKSSTTDNEELEPPSPKTRNTLVIITVVLALFVMTVSAFYRHRKRKQHAAKMAVNNGDAIISTPVGDQTAASASPATATAGAAPYQAESSTATTI